MTIEDANSNRFSSTVSPIFTPSPGALVVVVYNVRTNGVTNHSVTRSTGVNPTQRVFDNYRQNTSDRFYFGMYTYTASAAPPAQRITVNVGTNKGHHFIGHVVQLTSASSPTVVQTASAGNQSTGPVATVSLPAAPAATNTQFFAAVNRTQSANTNTIQWTHPTLTEMTDGFSNRTIGFDLTVTTAAGTPAQTTRSATSTTPNNAADLYWAAATMEVFC